jgi:hypothetical protein
MKSAVFTSNLIPTNEHYFIGMHHDAHCRSGAAAAELLAKVT